ncbi:MAG: RdgB/HAM1 family non-canonical purine NTP pyrophosphatase [Flavobacteriales bacterium]|nr:RdgB/HAM1 family non-canonical purine NTP pyrophosphatase [Flavobacteriales bacterium]
MRIVLCTGNPGKVAELRALLPVRIELVTLGELGIPGDLPESGETLEENALQKARYVFERCGLPCLSDDTGLAVEALGGAPGVHSARYAGTARDADANMDRLLRELEGVKDRSAAFRTVLALVGPEGEQLFEGSVHGRIGEKPIGKGGFGYDPIFLPQGSSRTFAEMDAEAKNRISHRALAMEKFLDWIRTEQIGD